MSDFFIGEIRMFGFAWAPQDWALCQGQVLQMRQNAALYALIGTQFGGVAGQTFALPDLRGQVMQCQNNATLSRGGVESVQLTTAQIPPHTHLMNVVSNPTAANWRSSPNNTRYLSNVGTDTAGITPSIYAAPVPGKAVAMNTTTIEMTGGSAAHSNIQPSTVVNYCISVVGLFPSRN
jgi:microcystin-dependent protein